MERRSGDFVQPEVPNLSVRGNRMPSLTPGKKMNLAPWPIVNESFNAGVAYKLHINLWDDRWSGKSLTRAQRGFDANRTPFPSQLLQ
jgi:hypothetical protein